ncbi:MAG: methyltransferase [Saprospiraceae bacterium]|nr:methyltransferase [Saprospiraceae bacterium]
MGTEAKSTTRPGFQFKQFKVVDRASTMKIGIDAVLLGAWADHANPQRILDIGTGCGVVMLMLAQRFADAQVLGVEIDANAAEEAKQNALTTPWHDRLKILQRSIQEYALQEDEKYDLVVCNPPFFSGGTLSRNMRKNDVRHTVKLSHQDLLRAARSMLHKTGIFSVVLPLLEGLRFAELARTYGMHLVRKTSISAHASEKPNRVLLSFAIQSQPTEEDQLVIYDGEERWSNEFWHLTKDFYIKRK